MTVMAKTSRHIATLWQGVECWQWVALKTGKSNHAKRGFNRWGRTPGYPRWTFHLTPVHVERDGAKWEVGLCLGRRMVYLLSHR